MRAVVQRVTECRVVVEDRQVGSIAAGLLVYVGFETGDAETDLRYLADKIINLRVFPDSDDRMNLSLREVGQELLVVSQFTLHADVRKGRRPSYNRAAAPQEAEALYADFLDELRRRGIDPQQGRFGAKMQVTYTNNGPITVLLDSKKQF